MDMPKLTFLSLTDHEISLIYTSISNHKIGVVKHIAKLESTEDGDYARRELAALVSIKKKIVDL